MRGDIEMQDSTPVVAQDHEDKQEVECRRRYGEEIKRNEIMRMVLDERTPGLRRPFARLNHVFRDSRLGNLNAELQQLAVKRPIVG